MFNYSEIKRESERIKKEYPIINYFNDLVNSGFLKYEGRYGKEHFFGFLSQRTGSIAVDEQANVWYDHSAGRGGDIIEAVQVFEDRSFPQSVERLVGSTPSRVITRIKKPQDPPKIEIERVVEISHPALVDYLESRGLEPGEISVFAKEVHWRNKGKSFFAIGFPNEAGGWVLRSSIFKGNILGGGISIQVLGKIERIKVFEGWFDFLSYMKLSGTTDFKAIILNSTANLSIQLGLEILKECEKVDLYLDNDDTGNKCTSIFTRVAQLYRYCLENGLDAGWHLKLLKGRKQRIEMLLDTIKVSHSRKKGSWRAQTCVSDKRHHYDGFEDVNAFLVARIKK